MVRAKARPDNRRRGVSKDEGPAVTFLPVRRPTHVVIGLDV
jgi:hypothetical protein